MFKVQSIGPVSQPQWTEEAEGRQRLSPDQSILSFPGYPRSRPPPHWPAPSQSAQSEMGGSHASNKSHHGHGNKPLRELLLKQALFHAVSYLVYHQFYQWDVMSLQSLYTRHIWFKYVSLCQEREQKYQLQACHTLSLGVISSQQFLSLLISSVAVSVWVEGKGTKPDSTMYNLNEHLIAQVLQIHFFKFISSFNNFQVSCHTGPTPISDDTAGYFHHLWQLLPLTVWKYKYKHDCLER